MTTKNVWIRYLLFLTLFIPLVCKSQNTKSIDFHSAVLNENRKLWVNTPDYYDLRRDSLHLIILLDGDNKSLFEYSVAAKRFLEKNATDLSDFNAPESIIVGIQQKDRAIDFSEEVGSDKFLLFLTNEVMPYIKIKYRVVDYTILIGHSLGGRFALNAFIRRPDLFNAIIAASPAYTKNHIDEVEFELDSVIKKGLGTDRAIYVATTYIKEDQTEQQFREFAENLNTHFHTFRAPNFRFEFNCSSTLGHAKSPYFAIPEGLHFIYSPELWQLDSDSLFSKTSTASRTVAAYQKRIRSEFGISAFIHPYISIIATELMAVGDDHEAITLLRNEVGLDPTDIDLFALLLAELKKHGEKELTKYTKEFQSIMNTLKVDKTEQADWYSWIEKNSK
jgi:predicted alpha/beta superfamily hydrolase